MHQKRRYHVNGGIKMQSKQALSERRLRAAQDCRIAGAAVGAQAEAEAEAESGAGIGPPVSSLLLVAAFSRVMQFDAAQNRTIAHTHIVATHTHIPTHTPAHSHTCIPLSESRAALELDAG